MNLPVSKPSYSPLLTFVVVNWNYGKYIGSTINSIINQTYPHFQCIVVDNGSDDNSVEIAIKAIGGDSRFTLVEEARNVGHLAAVLRVSHLIKGDFVSIVDSDDFLLPIYAAAHLQTHLSFERPVGVTTSNLIEISWNGTIVAGSRTIDRDLQAEERMPSTPKCRIDGIAAESIQLLADATLRISNKQNGWIWFPGTSNVLRRPLFEAAMQLSPTDVPVRHFSDTFFLGICHLLEGTALINLPLSVYRRHDQNTENTSEIMKLGGLRVQRRQAADRDIDQRLRLCAAVFVNWKALDPWMHRNHLWSAADKLLRVPDKKRRLHYGNPIVRTVIEAQFVDLAKEFGAFETLRRLRERMSFPDLLRCFVGGLFVEAAARLAGRGK